jgi:sulfite reductase (NADPH) hemoprotein beta-component
VAESGVEHEPIYGDAYLPRKFKIAVAVPPYNDVDVFANDLGLIAIVDEAGGLAGFNVAIGGSMGASHGIKEHYPRVGNVIGFVSPDQVLAVAEAAVTVQRDLGDREDRKHARFKYTIDDHGAEKIVAMMEERAGFKLRPARPYRFEHNGDRFGWVEGENGLWHLTLSLPSGRIADTPGRPLLTGLREIAKVHRGEFRMTCNQNVIVAGVPADERARIDALVAQHALDLENRAPTAIARSAVACVALPTCALAMAEAERYLPELVTKIEAILDANGLSNDAITIRMSGCPNGCSRPYIAEIALTGRAPGKYNLYLGGGFHGQRLNRMIRENIDEAAILAVLSDVLGRFSRERQPGERFGDFTIRAGIVREVTEGRLFND